MKRLLPWFTACALLCGWGLGWAQTAKVSLTAQERLDAIRHSLVETALQGATQVRSTQWLDQQGQLRDASSFRSGMEVRGVQVRSYSRDSAGNVQAQLSSPNASKDLTRNPSNSASVVDDSCKPQTLRHVLGLTTVFEAGTSAAIQKQVRQQITAQWLSASDGAWRMVELNVVTPVLSTGALTSSYEQALTRGSTQQLPWAATLRVSAKTQELKTWEKIAGRSAHHAEITLELAVSGAQDASGQSKQFQASQSLNLPLKNTDWASTSLDDVGAAQLQQVGRLWGDRLGQWIGCDPLQPQVTQRRANQVQINAGGLAGVRPGDEWLLADPKAFPSQVVGPSSAALLLAKVVEVTPHHAQLAVLAGPADAVQTHWRAWPAESLNR
jgi:uncharacterized glyoxalase superfamily protein PhnB